MLKDNKKIKVWWLTHKNTVIWAIIAILALSVAFGLGFLAGADSSPAPIIIEKMSEN